MGSRAEKKKAWFEHGVQAAALVTDGEVEGYICPLCASVFTDIGDLTFEHAPPKSLGGREVTLTCEACNNGGHKLDAAMRKDEDLVDWRMGTSAKPIRARAEVLGVRVNVQTERRDGAFIITGLPDRNDPVITARHRVALDALVALPASEQSITVDFPRHRLAPSDVDAGWLRTGYLVAFAQFGYRYALRSLMEPVRAQITDPAGMHLDRFVLDGPSYPGDRRVLMSVDAPRSLRSIAVIMGRHLVFLPGLYADSDTLYNRLDARAYWPPRSLRTLRGATLDWPTRPVMALDFG